MSDMDCPKFFWRRRWFAIASLICIAMLIASCRYFNNQPEMLRDTCHDDISSQVYGEVLRRWYNYTGPKKWFNNENMSMWDDVLVKEIREEWIVEKWDLSPSYTLSEPKVHDPSMGQARAIMEILENKKNGFFIECGAYDGETRSNTLVLERFLGWSGILIEADPINFSAMLGKNRRAHMSPTCLSIRPYPMNVSFLMARNIGRIHDPSEPKSAPNTMDVAYEGQHVLVQCFPLASYVAAFGNKTVDYLSLDVEGSEMDILETIPFDKLDIKTLSVEYIHGKKDRSYMIDYMGKQGYYVHSFVENEDNLANDVIFVKKES